MFTILVIMALVTTAMTSPLLWAVWLRHQKLPEPLANFVATENYLTAGLDPDYPTGDKQADREHSTDAATETPPQVGVPDEIPFSTATSKLAIVQVSV